MDNLVGRKVRIRFDGKTATVLEPSSLSAGCYWLIDDDGRCARYWVYEFESIEEDEG